MDKTLILVLFPFFTIVLLVGFVAFYARGGRPLSLKLKGLGIMFELKSSAASDLAERRSLRKGSQQ